jgi:nucleoside-diphosphate-sugar epimerase
MTGSQRYVITGASGGLGHALVARLPRENIFTIVRCNDAAVPAAACVRADIVDAEWGAIVEPSDVVFHLAAFVHRPACAEEVRRAQDVNTAATSRLAAACRSRGAKLVFASTVAIYGAGAEGLSDDSPPNPSSEYARTKLSAEEAIRTEGARGLRYAILRLPLMYGPWGRGNMEKMLRAIGSGGYYPVGERSTLKSCLFFDDAATAFLLAARNQQCEGGTFVVAPRTPDTLGDINDAAYRSLGKHAPRVFIPTSLALILGRTADLGLRAVKRKARLAEQITTLTQPAWYHGTRFADRTGFRATVPIAEGLVRTAAWLRGEVAGR